MAKKCYSLHQVCGKCGKEDHNDKDCIKTECKNCVDINKKLKLNLVTNHCAWDKQCPVYIKRVKDYRKNVNYA